MKEIYTTAALLKEWREGIDHEAQLALLKEIHLLEYTANDYCIYCGNFIEDKKVFDHHHYRNTYNGPAHSLCKLRMQKQKELPLFFHNAAYDINLILKYIGSNEIAANRSFWDLSKVGQRVKFVCADSIVINDSYALLPMALSELGKQLDDKDRIYQHLYGEKIIGDYGKG